MSVLNNTCTDVIQYKRDCCLFMEFSHSFVFVDEIYWYCFVWFYNVHAQLFMMNFVFFPLLKFRSCLIKLRNIEKKNHFIRVDLIAMCFRQRFIRLFFGSKNAFLEICSLTFEIFPIRFDFIHSITQCTLQFWF